MLLDSCVSITRAKQYKYTVRPLNTTACKFETCTHPYPLQNPKSRSSADHHKVHLSKPDLLTLPLLTSRTVVRQRAHAHLSAGLPLPTPTLPNRQCNAMRCTCVRSQTVTSSEVLRRTNARGDRAAIGGARQGNATRARSDWRRRRGLWGFDEEDCRCRMSRPATLC